MPFITRLLIGLALSYISYLFTPPPKGPKAASLDDLDIPKSDEGAEIGIGHGTVWVTDPHMHWYGDFNTKAIKEKGGKK